MTREQTLLVAAWKLLNKQNETPYVLELLNEEIHYDDADCDGNCLMDDIQTCLFEYGIDVEEVTQIVTSVDDENARKYLYQSRSV